MSAPVAQAQVRCTSASCGSTSASRMLRAPKVTPRSRRAAYTSTSGAVSTAVPSSQRIFSSEVVQIRKKHANCAPREANA